MFRPLNYVLFIQYFPKWFLSNHYWIISYHNDMQIIFLNNFISFVKMWFTWVVIEFWCLNEQGLDIKSPLRFRKNDSLIFSKTFFWNPLVKASEMFLGGAKDSKKSMPSPIVISDSLLAISSPRSHPTISGVVTFNHQWLSILVSFLLKIPFCINECQWINLREVGNLTYKF